MSDKVRNIFNTSGLAEGDSFIGKKTELVFFREKYLYDGGKAAYSIVGLPKTGKTSFVKIVFEDADNDILIIDCNLKIFETFDGMWKNICKKIQRYIKDNIIDNDLLNDLLVKLIAQDYKDEWDTFAGDLNLIFEELSNVNIKIIFIFDQFDYAKKLFDSVQKFQLVRTILSEYSNISPLIISRCPIHEIEGKNIQASSFFGVVEPRYFNTFDDADVREFHKILFRSGINLSDTQIREMEYYTGRIPYLYSVMGHFIIENYNNNIEIDIKNIFSQNKEYFNQYYRECIEYLRKTDYLRKLLPFSIGPKIGVKKLDTDELYNIGYLKENPDNEDERFIIISKYFMTFLTTDLLEDISIWDNIIGTEKKLKHIIKRELTRIVRKFQIYGEDENTVLGEIMQKCNIPKSSLDGKYARFMENNYNLYGRVCNYLDVMSMSDAIKIIKKCWLDIFCEYFNNDSYSDWKPAFDLCVRVRNPFAHGQDGFLDDYETNLASQYCMKILNILNDDNILNIDVSDENYLDVARMNCNENNNDDNMTDIEEYSIPDEIYRGKDGDLYITAIINTVTKSRIKGYVEYNNEKYPAIIPKNYCTSELLGKNIGDIIRVQSYKINFGMYEVKPV